MKPTDVQVKKFWERCGFIYKPDWEKCWKYPNSPHHQSTATLKITLNNLFKYAVPKLLEKEGYYFELRSPYKDMPYCAVIGKHNEYEAWTLHSSENEDPALALFYALQEAMK